MKSQGIVITITGPKGTGKSVLAAAISETLSANGHPVEVRDEVVKGTTGVSMSDIDIALFADDFDKVDLVDRRGILILVSEQQPDIATEFFEAETRGV